MTATGILAASGFGYTATMCAAAGAEFDSVIGSPTIVTSSTQAPHDGTYCGRCSSPTSGTRMGFGLRFSSAAINETYDQVWVCPRTFPGVATSFAMLTPTGATSTNCQLLLLMGTSGAITYRYTNSSGTLVAAASTIGTLVLNQWNLVEFHVADTGTGTSSITIKLGGTTILTATALNMTNNQQVYLYAGLNLNLETDTTADVCFDGMAVANASGTWFGGASVVYLQPDGDGGSHMWNTDSGSGSGTNWQHVQDPTSTTIFAQSTTLNDVDTYTMSASGIASGSTILAVLGMVREKNDAAQTSESMIFTITANGSPSATSGFSPNTNVLKNGSNTAGLAYPAALTLYQDPTSVNWTPATLDGMTMSIKLSADASTHLIQVPAVWATVIYIPAAPAANPDLFAFVASNL